MANRTVDWDKIKAEYLAGNSTYAELAEKYGVSKSTLGKRATSEGWKNGRKKVSEKVAKKIETRAARAREEKVLKGVQLTRYIAALWTDNLKELNELIKATPEQMLKRPEFAAGIPRGLRETYDLLMDMSGKGFMSRKLQNEQRKLKLEQEKFEFEKEKWRREMEAREAAMKAGTGEAMSWVIEEDTDEGGLDFGK